MAEVITIGEASDLRERIRAMEARQSQFEKDLDVRVSVHESKCAFRYMTIMVAVGMLALINLPAAAPHLLTIAGFLK